MQIAIMSTPQGDQLRAIRTKLRQTQEEFALNLGVSRGRYKNWEYGHALPPQDVLDRAMGLDSRKSFELKGLPMAPIPVVGAVAAGPGADLHPEIHQLWVPSHMILDGTCGWEAEGVSMMPWIQPGDVVVAKEHKVPRLGLAFLIRREDGSNSVKVLSFQNGDYVYESLNPQFEPEPAKGELLGFVTGIYRTEGSLETIFFDPNGLRPKNFF